MCAMYAVMHSQTFREIHGLAPPLAEGARSVGVENHLTPRTTEKHRAAFASIHSSAPPRRRIHPTRKTQCRSSVHCRSSNVVSLLSWRGIRTLGSLATGIEREHSRSVDWPTLRRTTSNCTACQNDSIDSMTEKVRHVPPLRARLREDGSISSNTGQSIKPWGRLP